MAGKADEAEGLQGKDGKAGEGMATDVEGKAEGTEDDATVDVTGKATEGPAGGPRGRAGGRTARARPDGGEEALRPSSEAATEFGKLRRRHHM